MRPIAFFRLDVIILGLSLCQVQLLATEPDSQPFLQTVEYPVEKLSDKAEVSIGVFLPEDHQFTEGFSLHFRIGLRDAGSDDGGVLKEGDLAEPSEEGHSR